MASSSTPPLCRESEGGQNQHYVWVSSCNAQSTTFISFESRPEYADCSQSHFNSASKVTCDDLYEAISISTETPRIAKSGSGQFSSPTISSIKPEDGLLTILPKSGVS